MKKLTYKARKETDSSPLKTIQKDLMTADIKALPKGNYRITIEKWQKSKSLPQLGYLFGCVYPMFLQAAIDAGWDELTSIDEVDAWCKSMFANREIVNKDSGQIISIPAFKREMTTVEMMTFINQVRDHCAEYFNVHIPGPEEQINLNI